MLKYLGHSKGVLWMNVRPDGPRQNESFGLAFGQARIKQVF